MAPTGNDTPWPWKMERSRSGDWLQELTEAATLAFTRTEGRKRPRSPSLSPIFSSAWGFPPPALSGGAPTTTARDGGSGAESEAGGPSSVEGKVKGELEWAAVLRWLATLGVADDRLGETSPCDGESDAWAKEQHRFGVEEHEQLCCEDGWESDPAFRPWSPLEGDMESGELQGGLMSAGDRGSAFERRPVQRATLVEGVEGAV